MIASDEVEWVNEHTNNQTGRLRRRSVDAQRTQTTVDERGSRRCAQIAAHKYTYT